MSSLPAPGNTGSHTKQAGETVHNCSYKSIPFDAVKAMLAAVTICTSPSEHYYCLRYVDFAYHNPTASRNRLMYSPIHDFTAKMEFPFCSLSCLHSLVIETTAVRHHASCSPSHSRAYLAYLAKMSRAGSIMLVSRLCSPRSIIVAVCKRVARDRTATYIPPYRQR